MEYFILNEHSLPINDNSKVDACLVQFFEVYKLAVKCNFKHIRVSNTMNNSAWYAITVADHKSLRSWISEQSFDYSSRLKSLISATQCSVYDQSQIEEEYSSGISEFSYEEQDVPYLGAIHLLGQLSFSFNSSKIWNHSTFKIMHVELTEEDDILEREVDVRNVSTLDHWQSHFSIIESTQIKAVKESKEIIEELTLHFPNIGFTNSAIKQLNNNNFTSVFFSEIWRVLKELNNTIDTIEGNFNSEIIKAKSTLAISDESNTVKQKPKLKRHRQFMYNDEQHFFGFHVKNFRNQERMHFIVYDNKLVIGYIGKHLPL